MELLSGYRDGMIDDNKFEGNKNVETSLSPTDPRFFFVQNDSSNCLDRCQNTLFFPFVCLLEPKV